MSMRLKRVDEQWLQYVTEAGRTFYYNERSGSFQWQHPKTHPECVGGSGGSSSSASSSGSSAAASRGLSVSAPADLSPDWQPYTDEQSGAVFWYNSATLVSQWHPPWDAADGTEAAEANNDGCARRVTDDKDLGI